MGEAGVIWPRSKGQFAVGCFWALLAALHFADHNSAHASIFGQYDWLVWALGSVFFFVQAYRSPKQRPVEKPQ